MDVLKPLGLSVLALAALSSPVGAVSFNVEVSGWCSINCAAVGLAQNEDFAGVVGIDDATFEAGQWDTSAVTAFSFAFGTFALSQSSTATSNNLVRWGSTPDAVSEIYIFAFGSDDPATRGPYLSLSATTESLGTGYAAIDAFFAIGKDGEFAGSEGNGAILNTKVLGYGSVPPAPVPLPAAGWLLLGSLLGLGALRQARPIGG
jgi:hypothetical protein